MILLKLISVILIIFILFIDCRLLFNLDSVVDTFKELYPDEEVDEVKLKLMAAVIVVVLSLVAIAICSIPFFI